MSGDQTGNDHAHLAKEFAFVSKGKGKVTQNFHQRVFLARFVLLHACPGVIMKTNRRGAKLPSRYQVRGQNPEKIELWPDQDNGRGEKEMDEFDK